MRKMKTECSSGEECSSRGRPERHEEPNSSTTSSLPPYHHHSLHPKIWMISVACNAAVNTLPYSIDSITNGNFEGDQSVVENRSIGSSPPRCEHKCFGCSPCEATQVPTTNSGRVRVQYSNYEPEGWKCKCGPSFYSP
ncbi:hypothetical protein QVD17_26014 [Tagetes erecta]|uniref:Epidermal patterning factor-like protein n=1 Tax=Tagetes erecta TaxID=13708 RepID=A0AAD8NI66_TARER|nr:hypothetical protein QVD17_26014 [Tagetes erecta]